MVLDELERLLNRFIAESTPATGRVRALDGQSLAVVFVGLPVELVMLAEDGRLRLALDGSEDASVTIRATPLDLVHLLGPGALARLKSTHAEISGDLHVAEEFAGLLSAAMPDVEEELARWIGDIPAHGLAEGVRSAARSSLRAGRSLETSLSEYLRAEAGLLPRLEEIEAFCAAVDDLRDDVDRLEQRIDVLRRHRPRAAS